MTSEERLRILEMVAEGKLTTDEADELLGAMEPAPQPPGAATATSACRSCTETRWSGASTPRRTAARDDSRSGRSTWSRASR